MTELDHLRAFRAADAIVPPAARETARAALLARAEAAAPPRAAASRRRLALPRRGRVLGGALALAAAATTVAVLAVGLGSGGVEPTDATAAQLLRRAADVAAHGPDVVLRPGQFWYTRSESLTRTTAERRRTAYAYLQHIRREAWIGRGGGSRVRQYAVGRVRFLRPRDRAAWVAAGRPRMGGGVMDVSVPDSHGPATRRFYLGAMPLTYAQLRALPTRTDALYALVAGEAHANHNSHGDPHEMFTIVGDMLREAPIPPALRAAFFRVAARIPGVRLVGRTRDAAGRPGVAVALREAHQSRELVFDARTAALLGEREVDAGGRPLFVSAYLASGVVDATSQRPKP